MEFTNNTTSNNQPIKNNSIINRIFDRDYLESLEYVVSIIIRRDDVKNAYPLLEVLQEAVAARRSELDVNKRIGDFYKKILVNLKFVSFPLLENEDNIDLIKNYFTWQFDLPDYNIIEKLSHKLLNILILEDRDKFKADLKTGLLNNQEIITKQSEIKSISGWLKNYNVSLDTGIVDILKRTQYFVDLTKVKGLDELQISRLKALFNFYEVLKLSSLTQSGFDEEPPILIDKDLYIFRRGVLEQVTKPKLMLKENKVAPASFVGSDKGRKAVDNSTEFNPAILRKLADQYPAGSLERRVIEEEIKKQEEKGG